MARKILLVILAVAVGMIVLASIELKLFYGPWPWQSPREADRVRHPDGYSIIKPRGWWHRAGGPPPGSQFAGTLRLHPNTQSRLYPDILVAQWVSPPDLGIMKTSLAYQAGTFYDGSFQGRPAQFYEGNAGKFWDWEVMFERGGRWYRVTVMSPSESAAEDHVQKDLLPYVETFQAAQKQTDRSNNSLD